MLKVDAPNTWTPLVLLIAAAVLAVPAPVPAQTKSAGDTYLDKCAVCHGEDGAGKTAKGKKLKVKDVRETLKKLTAEQMAEVVTKGKDPDMDAFGKELKPDQIKQIVAYYRDLAAKK
jgi:mono/diheme cytochrome c family protein